MEIVNIWKPEYGISVIIKMLTAIISVATACSLVPYIPKLLNASTFDHLLMSREDMRGELRRLREENIALKRDRTNLVPTETTPKTL